MIAWLLDPQNAKSCDNANVLTMQIPATPVVANWLAWGFPFRRTHCTHNKPRYPLELEDSIKSDIKNCRVITDISDKL
jgi:hypothetical protein